MRGNWGQWKSTQLNKDPEPIRGESALPFPYVSVRGWTVYLLPPGAPFSLSLTPHGPRTPRTAILLWGKRGQPGSPGLIGGSLPGVTGSQDSFSMDNPPSSRPEPRGGELVAPGPSGGRPHLRPPAAPQVSGKPHGGSRQPCTVLLPPSPRCAQGWRHQSWRLGTGGSTDWMEGGMLAAQAGSSSPRWTATWWPGIQQQPRERRPGSPRLRGTSGSTSTRSPGWADRKSIWGQLLACWRASA